MIKEENTPKEYLGKKYTTYEALQAQRRMETRMRKTRQDIRLMQDGGADPQDIVLKKAKYQGQMQTYKAFSEAMELPEQMERVYQDGLRGKFTPTKTELARIEKTVAKSKESDTMESNLGTFKQKLRNDENIDKEYYEVLKGRFYKCVFLRRNLKRHMSGLYSILDIASIIQMKLTLTSLLMRIF